MGSELRLALERLLARVDAAGAKTRERILRMMLSLGFGNEATQSIAVDLETLPEDVVDAVHFLVSGTLPRPTEGDQSARWERYRRATRSSSSSSKGLLQSPVVVAPAQHFGRSVGQGLFAVVPLHRGQLLFPFTGSVHGGDTTAYVNKTKARREYCIRIRYGPRAYAINPLTAEGRVHPDHIAAFMNEPSPPPWKLGSVVAHGGRNGVVRGYSHTTGTYEIEFARRTLEVPASEVTSHPLQPPAQTVFEANCHWYDFPVPLAGLYAPTRARRGSEYVWRRRGTKAIVEYEWTLKEFASHFTSVLLPDEGVFRLDKHRLPEPGTLVFLNDECFAGLRRASLVVQTARSHVRVRHAVSPSTAWRLPGTVLAGKATRCASCRDDDDPLCAKCTWVPFPLVHACKDLSPGQELLCLYSTRVASRGLACARPLDDDDLMPMWDS